MNNLAEISPEPVETMDLIGRVGRLADRRDGASGSKHNLEGDCPETLLSALLNEFDETMLPRRFKVTPERGEAVEVLVSNRRLIAMTDSQTVECTNSKFVLDHLRATLGLASRVTFNTVRVENTFSGAHNGVSAKALLALLSAKPSKQPDPNPVPAFFAELRSDMFAWVTLSHAGRIHKNSGDAVWRDRLVELAETHLATLEAQRRQSQTSTDQPACILLNFGNADGFILIYARSNTSGFLALLPMASLAAIQSAWKTRPS